MNIDPSGYFPWLIAAAILLFTPVGGYALNAISTTVSYVSNAVISIWDEDIRYDMNLIGWNPFNADESLVLQSRKISYYKGASVFRTNMDASAGFGGIILLSNRVKDDRYGISHLRHEYGHVIQSRWLGIGMFGIVIGIPSIISVITNPKNHHNQWFEIWADQLGGV